MATSLNNIYIVPRWYFVGSDIIYTIDMNGKLMAGLYRYEKNIDNDLCEYRLNIFNVDLAGMDTTIFYEPHSEFYTSAANTAIKIMKKYGAKFIEKKHMALLEITIQASEYKEIDE